MDFPTLDSGIIRAADARQAGLARQFAHEVAEKRLVRVRRGFFAPALPSGTPQWKADDVRYARLVAAAADALLAPVFTGFSALKLHGLPTFGRWPDEVHVMATSKNGRRRRGAVEVAGRYAPETSVVDGRYVTSIEFTLIQVCRTGTLAAALVAVDAALRVPRFGSGTALTTIERLRHEHERLLPYPNSRRTEAVLERATSQSESVLETGSRLLIEELGFEAPTLQRSFWLPELGITADVDFMWETVRAAAEADGEGKYLGNGNSRDVGAPRADSGDARRGAELARRAADRVVREKNRENALRRQLAGLDRWDWHEFTQKRPVEERLQRMGVPRTRPRRALIGSPSEPALRPRAPPHPPCPPHEHE